MPQYLMLNLNVYLDPAWHKIHGDNAVAKALTVIDEANEILQDESLNTKVNLLKSLDRIYNSSTRHRTFSRNLGRISKLARPPLEMRGLHNRRRDNFKVVHVYLTVGGLAEERSLSSSICDHSRIPISIIKWDGWEDTTAAYLALSIGQILGFKHGYVDKEQDEHVCKSFSNITSTNLNYSLLKPGIKVKWSPCSNEDFSKLYKKVIEDQHTFCLEEIRIK